MEQPSPVIPHPAMTAWQRALIERNWCIFAIEAPKPNGKMSKYPTDHVGSEYEFDRVNFDQPVSIHTAARYTYAEVCDLMGRLQPSGAIQQYRHGYLSRPGSALVVGDLDDCRDPQTGQIDPWAQQILNAGQTYAEVSVSGTGIRLLMERMEGDDQQTHREKNGAGFFANGKLGAVLTGNCLPGHAVEPQAVPAVRDAILARRGPMAADGEPKSSVVTDPVPFELVREMLMALPNTDLEYDDWWRVGMSVKASLGDQGRELFEWWSRLSGKFNAKDQATEWRSMDPQQITFGTLTSYVKDAHGGKYPTHLAAMMQQRGEQRMQPDDPWADCPDWPDAPYNLPDPKVMANIVDASQLAGIEPPEREWTVVDLVPRKQVTLLTGNGGVGKSLVALQLAVAVAAGQNWLDQMTARGNALFLTAEDELAEVHRRLVKIAEGYGVALEQLPNLRLWSLAGRDAVIATTGQNNVVATTPLFDQIRNQIAQVQPEVVVLDTLADLFAGDENNRSQGTQFVAMLIGLAIEYNCAVVLLAHPSKSGQATGDGTSGSTAWHNKVRSRLYLRKETAQNGIEPDPRCRVIDHMKANYGPDDNTLRIRFDDGRFVPLGAPDLPENNQAMVEWKAEFLRLLDMYKRQGRTVGESKHSENFAPKVFAEHPSNENSITKFQYKLAMEQLLADGIIEITDTDGPPSKRKKIIVRCLQG